MVHENQPLRHTFPGVPDLESYIQKASAQAKGLVRKECSVLLECRCCSNIFRSVPNFVLHKTKYCRNSYTDSVSDVIRVVSQRNDSSGLSLMRTGCDTGTKFHSSRNVVPVRRINLVRHLMNKSSLVGARVNGSMNGMDLIALPKFRRQLAVVPLANGKTASIVASPYVTVKDSNPDEVLLVMPQDLSVQYRNMNLRLRSAEQITRKITLTEAECINRMNKFVRTDPVGCRCLADECSDVRPFKDVFTLAFHVTMRHCHRIPPHSVLPCMLCTKSFTT